MRNWLGQDIVAGTLVYRGAREGNSSSFKVGVVESVDAAKGTARVAWKFEPGHAWRNINGTAERIRAPLAMESKGSPSIDSLVVIDPRVMDKLNQATYFLRQWKDGSMSNDVIKQALESIFGT